MSAPLAYVAFLLDDSGSMGAYVDSTCEAYNAYIDTLKEVKGAQIRYTLWKFGGNGLERSPMQRDVPIQDAFELNEENYKPNSGTQLYWAVIKLAENIEKDLQRQSNPQKVVVCIQTDGQSARGFVDQIGMFDEYGPHNGNNSGRNWKAIEDYCGEIVRKKQKEGWEFVFMAAVGQSYGGPAFDYRKLAITELGIPSENVLEYGQGSKGSVAAFSATAMNVGAFSSGRARHVSFTDEQRRRAR